MPGLPDTRFTIDVVVVMNVDTLPTRSNGMINHPGSSRQDIYLTGSAGIEN